MSEGLDAFGVHIIKRADAEPFEALVFAGEPLHEPVARYGPFVMNTKQEIVEAIDDFEAGHLA